VIHRGLSNRECLQKQTLQLLTCATSGQAFFGWLSAMGACLTSAFSHPLDLAAYNGDVAAIEEYLGSHPSEDINTKRGAGGLTPLIHAASRGMIDRR
jgi:hypothetical protein